MKISTAWAASFFASAPFGDGAASVGAGGLSDNFDSWFPLATDLLLNASFPADELAKLKQRLKVQLVQQRQQPSFLTTERFNEAGLWESSTSSRNRGWHARIH